MKKSDGTTDWGAIVIWTVLIVFVLWGIYTWGANNTERSLNPLTPQQMRDENTKCRQWTGEDCPPYSAN